MASFVTVIHAARQYKIQCTPAKILNDVLVEACTKVGVPSDSYGLRHGKTTLDLSMSVRLAHLPGGAKLDLVKVAADASAVVNVALNMPDVSRKTASIAPSSTLWQALEVFERQYSITILKASQRRNGQFYKQQVVVQLMNKEYTSNQQLKETTLASLGIKSGSAVLRVSFRPTDDLISMNHDALLQVVPVSPDTTAGTTTHTHSIVTTDREEIAPPIVPSERQPSPLPMVRKRNIEVLLPSSSTVPHYGAFTEPEDDLSMSVAQAKAYQASLASRSQASSAPLLTQKYRDQQAQERRLKLRPETCRVKFRFPDGTQVIGSFAPNEVASELYAFVMDLLTTSHAQSTFELEVLGDRKRIPNSHVELWQDLSFGKAVAVQVQGNVHVKAEYKSQGKDVGQVVAQSGNSRADSNITKQETESSPAQSQSTEEDKSAKKMPKWLQKTLGKK